MHALHTAPAKEDGAPDKATRDRHEVPSHGASSELPRLMHAQLHKMGLPGALNLSDVGNMHATGLRR